MWRGDVPTQRNPMELVTVKGASKRRRKPRSLTVAEFQRFIVHLKEPFRTMALLCVCFGLRISECLALKWSDVDWLNSKFSVQRGIVKQHVDDVKTIGSERDMTIDAGMAEVLKLWKQTSQFSASEDWMFASPAKIGRQPWSYDQVLRAFVNAGTDAGIGKLGTHSMQHSYRSWLDAVGTPIAVQQKLMRHADIRTTMNVYGDIVTDENGCEWQSRRVSAQRITGMNLKWCCSELEARVNQGGKAGFGILAAINKRGLLCFLEFRHADSTGASDFPEGGLQLKFCPWCGRNIDV